MELSDLKKIGLTDGEIKIYDALLELGECTRTNLAKKSGISPSKIYDVANRLSEKGIISIVKKEGIIHFSAADPERLNEFLEKKEQEIEQEKNIVKDILPTLLLKYSKTKAETDVEVLYGWKGMKTAFDDILKTMGKDDVNYIFGASLGKSPQQADIFFNQYYKKQEKKGYKIKIIFNENLRQYKARTEYFVKSKIHEIRFLHSDTFAETNVYSDKVLFIMLLKRPIIIRVTSKEAAESFRQFFSTMWQQAKG